MPIARQPNQPKVCPKCKVERAATEFWPSRGKRDGPNGLQSYCKRCCKEVTAAYRNGPWGKDYYEKHKAKLLARSRQWEKDNPERLKNTKAAWKHANQERDKARMRRGAAAKRARKLNAKGQFVWEEWVEICAKYGSQCLRCGLNGTPDSLTVDHIIPLATGGNNSPSNLQPLCGPCNSSKKLRTTDYRTEFHLEW